LGDRRGAFCIECGSTEDLEVHHLTYPPHDREFWCFMCSRCHDRFHRSHPVYLCIGCDHRWVGDGFDVDVCPKCGSHLVFRFVRDDLSSPRVWNWIRGILGRASDMFVEDDGVRMFEMVLQGCAAAVSRIAGRLVRERMGSRVTDRDIRAAFELWMGGDYKWVVL